MAPTPHICGSVSSELKDSPDNLIWHRRSWWSSKLVSAHLPNNNKREFPSERTGTTGLSPTRVSLDAEGPRLLIMSLSHSCLSLPTCCSTLRQDFDHDCHHDVQPTFLLRYHSRGFAWTCVSLAAALTCRLKDQMEKSAYRARSVFKVTCVRLR